MRGQRRGYAAQALPAEMIVFASQQELEIPSRRPTDCFADGMDILVHVAVAEEAIALAHQTGGACGELVGERHVDRSLHPSRLVVADPKRPVPTKFIARRTVD